MLHFTAPEGWINDPNGLVFHAGVWHLGYQAGWPRAWGHAISTDLLQWKVLPPMLEPDEHGQMWSGSAALDRHDSSGQFGGKPGLVAAYTSWGPPDTETKRQWVGLAWSSDGGAHWHKHAGNPVLHDPARADFRDPKIFWHPETQRWIAIVTVGTAMRLYTSPDLVSWEYGSTFGEGLLTPEVVWECPDLFPLPAEGAPSGRKWVLMASYVSQRNFAKPKRFDVCGERYFVGDFDGATFRADGDLDVPSVGAFGDTYASVTWNDAPDADRHRIAIGWMNHWGYANEIPTEPWQGALTLPRTLGLRAHGAGWRLLQNPIDALAAMRGKAARISDRTLQGGPVVLPGFDAPVADMTFDFEIGTASALDLRLGYGRQGEAHETVIGYRMESQTLFVDRSRSGLVDFHPNFGDRLQAPLPLEDGVLRLRLIIDHGSVEVFAGDGAVYLPALVFPAPGARSIAVHATGGTATLREAVFHPLGVWQP